MQLYPDCDGVLADFDKAATELFGMQPRTNEKRRGIDALWRGLTRHPDVYGTLPLMPDAMELFEAVRHLDPVIRTGLPRGKSAAPQKIRWAAEHFSGTKIQTVMALDKRKHAQEGDILVDDQLKHPHLWQDAGGIFVHHKSARNTLDELGDLDIPVRIAPDLTARRSGDVL